MSSKPSLNVSLTPELARFVAERVASGRYQTASEVVRAGLRLLERFEAAEDPPGLDGRGDGNGKLPSWAAPADGGGTTRG